jgi:hypothetical protein
MQEREALGDVFELEFVKDVAGHQRLKYIIWVPWYMHLLAPFYDYLLCDGSHGFGKYGWKWIPMCIRTSGGWTVPIGGVFGLEEDKDSLNILISHMRRHCIDHGVEAHLFTQRVPQDPFPRCNEDMLNWTKTHLRTFQYPPEWDAFMFQLECNICRNKDLSDQLVAFIPHASSKKIVLHADSGPAFVGLAR